jgi:hypothetical protein
MPCPSHPPCLDHSNYTWRRVRVMKLRIMVPYIFKILQSALMSPQWSLSFKYSNYYNRASVSPPSYTCYMPCTYYYAWFDNFHIKLCNLLLPPVISLPHIRYSPHTLSLQWW